MTALIFLRAPLPSKKTEHRSPAYFTLSLSHHLWRVILAQGPLMQQSVIRTDTRLYLAEAEFIQTPPW